MRKKVLHAAAARELLHRFRQGAAGTFESLTAGVATRIAVFIQYDQAGDSARSHRDVGLRPLAPPARDRRRVCGGVFEPVGDTRVLANAAAVRLTTGTATGRRRVARQYGASV